MNDDVTVTIRVSKELKSSVQAVSSELGISQSAVWKILLMRSLRPATEGGAQNVIENVTLRVAEGGGGLRKTAKTAFPRP